jgi:hypothetical protein
VLIVIQPTNEKAPVLYINTYKLVNMNTAIAYFIILVSFISCNTNAQKSCDFSIQNNTLYLIDSIKLTSYGVNRLIEDILPGKKVEETILINYTGQYEGAFLVTIYVKDSIKNQKTFGYFSNAKDIKPKYSLEVYNNFAVRQTR